MYYLMAACITSWQHVLPHDSDRLPCLPSLLSSVDDAHQHLKSKSARLKGSIFNGRKLETSVLVTKFDVGVEMS